jgi:hypothetical protein
MKELKAKNQSSLNPQTPHQGLRTVALKVYQNCQSKEANNQRIRANPHFGSGGTSKLTKAEIKRIEIKES